MSELYWITTLGKLNTLLWVCLGASAIAALILFGIFVETDYNEDEHIKSKKLLKLDALVILILSCGCTLTPTTDEIYLIYGAGTIVDYCKENSKVKEIPDKAIDALNRYLDRIAEDKKGQ